VPFAVAAFFSWYFVDEVWVDRENLIVKKRKKEIIIPIRQIANVEYSVLVRPGYITLALFEPCALGKRINYHPRDSWGLAFPFETCASVVRLQEKMVPNQSKDPTA
jgi:hypothetical protein